MTCRVTSIGPRSLGAARGIFIMIWEDFFPCQYLYMDGFTTPWVMPDAH